VVRNEIARPIAAHTEKNQEQGTKRRQTSMCAKYNFFTDLQTVNSRKAAAEYEKLGWEPVAEHGGKFTLGWLGMGKGPRPVKIHFEKPKVIRSGYTPPRRTIR
jgi:hypothetical protein